MSTVAYSNGTPIRADENGKGMVVNPSGNQSSYTRKRSTSHTSPAQQFHQKCVASNLEGTTGTRGSQQSKLKNAATQCSKANPFT